MAPSAAAAAVVIIATTVLVISATAVVVATAAASDIIWLVRTGTFSEKIPVVGTLGKGIRATASSTTKATRFIFAISLRERFLVMSRGNKHFVDTKDAKSSENNAHEKTQVEGSNECAPVEGLVVCNEEEAEGDVRISIKAQNAKGQLNAQEDCGDNDCQKSINHFKVVFGVVLFVLESDVQVCVECEVDRPDLRPQEAEDKCGCLNDAEWRSFHVCRARGTNNLGVTTVGDDEGQEDDGVDSKATDEHDAHEESRQISEVVHERRN